MPQANEQPKNFEPLTPRQAGEPTPVTSEHPILDEPIIEIDLKMEVKEISSSNVEEIEVYTEVHMDFHLEAHLDIILDLLQE